MATCAPHQQGSVWSTSLGKACRYRHRKRGKEKRKRRKEREEEKKRSNSPTKDQKKKKRRAKGTQLTTKQNKPVNANDDGVIALIWLESKLLFGLHLELLHFPDF